MRSILVLVTLAIVLSAGKEASSDSDEASAGVGSQSCAQFAQQYTATPDPTETLYFTWAQGYMSGFNRGLLLASEMPLSLNSKSQDAQKAFLRDYCHQHPLDSYARGVYALFSSLREVKRP
jgi:hypothetical protein